MKTRTHWRDRNGAACGSMGHKLALGYLPLNVTSYPEEVTCRRARCVRLAAAALRAARKRKA